MESNVVSKIENNLEETQEIYICKKCNYPLISSKEIFNTIDRFNDPSIITNLKIDLSVYKCMFIINKDEINNINKYCYDINLKKMEITCKNDSNNLGIIIETKYEKINIILLVGFLSLKDINIYKVKFNKLKEIPVYSQYEYVTLERLKNLRFFIKEATPMLESVKDRIQIEKRNICRCEDKFDKTKLTLVIDKLKELNKLQSIEFKKEDNNKKEENNFEVQEKKEE